MKGLLIAAMALAVLGCGARTSLPEGEGEVDAVVPDKPDPGKTSFLWSKRFGSLGDDQGLGVALDAAGNVFLTGTFAGTVDFGAGPIAGPVTAGQVVFLVKLDPDGHTLWSKAFGSGTGRGIAVDAAGNVVLVGDGGVVDFGGGPLPNPGAGTLFVAKLDNDGNHLFSRSFSKSASAGPGLEAMYRGHAVSIDPGGNIAIVGYYDGEVDFGAGPLSSAGKPRLFVAELDASGGHRWSHAFKSGDSSERYAITTDAASNVIVTGAFRTRIDFGGEKFKALGLADAFVFKLDSAGNHLWSHTYGSDSWTRGTGVAATASGDILITGTLDRPVTFGGPTASATAGNDDIFFLRLDAAGGSMDVRSFGGEFDDKGQAVVVDPKGRALLTGYFETGVDFGSGPLKTGGAYDVFVGRFGAGGEPLHSDGFGGPRDQIGWSLAGDAAANVVVTGWFDGSVDFGDGQLDTQGGLDMFVVKIPPP